MSNQDQQPELLSLERRRRILGMPADVLAARSGLSRSTVDRVLSGQYGGASFDAVQAIARALGAVLRIEYPVDSDAILQKQAEVKAAELVSNTLGSSALEKQTFTIPIIQSTTQATVQQLLIGPRRNLWSQ
jgi:transcriptional regulator with XRE-family HTH domain